MIEGIETAVERLAGTHLADLGRAADLQHFTFVVRGAAGPTLRLHVSCPWRLVGPAGVLAGAGDYWRPAEADTADDAYERGAVGARLRDVRNAEVRALLGAAGLEVLAAAADSLGGLRLQLAGGLTLEVFPDASAAAHDECEFWRLFEQGGPHVVVGTDGLDYVADV